MTENVHNAPKDSRFIMGVILQPEIQVYFFNYRMIVKDQKKEDFFFLCLKDFCFQQVMLRITPTQ